MEPTSTTQDNSPQDDRVLVTVDDAYALARIVGRGSYKVSKSLKEFAASVIDSGHPVFVLDLKYCVGMDSTFMGVLAGISQRQQKELGKKIILCSVSDKLINLMKTLGLNQLVDIQEELPDQAPQDLSELDRGNETPLDSAHTMLEAHEKLVEIDDDNQLRFQDVLDYLREDIKRQS
ncbi:STAS domain-containing protein [Kiritimatiellaeota bacterium B1221]|nr:STAS domain-containing protein [Kiritimatiellaeota bacterium B1221]